MSTLQERLRNATRQVRTKSVPLSDFIPLMQQAADRIDELEGSKVKEPTAEDFMEDEPSGGPC